jgi:hypothetical protein
MVALFICYTIIRNIYSLETKIALQVEAQHSETFPDLQQDLPDLLWVMRLLIGCKLNEAPLDRSAVRTLPHFRRLC